MQTSDTPLISVIVPVYNVAQYLRICLDSIVKQTYQNIEIILVASDSIDDSVEICEEYKMKDERVVLIYSKPNGLSDARNKGIDTAKGDYLSFIDSDDFIAPEFIQTLYEIITRYNCEVAQCNFLRVSEDAKVDSSIIMNQKTDIEIFSGLDMCYNLYNCWWISSVASWSKLYQKNLFKTIRFPVGKINEDQATTYKIFSLSNRIGFTKQTYYYYRKREESITTNQFNIKNLDYIIRFLIL